MNTTEYPVFRRLGMDEAKWPDMSGLEQTIWIKAWQKCGICAGSGKLSVLRRGKPERADCAYCEGKGVVDRYMSREEVRVWLGRPEKDPGADSSDAPSRPQAARTGPSEGKSDSRAEEEATPVAGPRYKVDDRVDGDEFEGGVVTSVETEPICVVRWRSGYVQRIKESLLSPRPAPVVCAPDGTRCAWMGAISGDADLFLTTANYCKMCGGKLTAGG